MIELIPSATLRISFKFPALSLLSSALAENKICADWICFIISSVSCSFILASVVSVFLRSIKDLKVSSHFLITRQGKLIQFVPIHKRAWHAGISNYKGREKCNDFSIGIELEGCDEDEFELQQYDTLSQLINYLSNDLKISKQNIVGHADIAPGRKTDPGPYFDWSLLQSML